MAGSTLEYTGYTKKTTQAARNMLEEKALMLVPALSKYKVIKHWAGLRPGSPDGIPFIGEHPQVSGLYMNTGHFRNGVVPAVIVHEILFFIFILSRESGFQFLIFQMLSTRELL